MAIMIPERPREYAAASQEGMMFDALASLPDTYYVFHSFKMVSTDGGELREKEADFVISTGKRGSSVLRPRQGRA